MKNTKITVSTNSDHKCVELSVHIDKYLRGPGLWKINNDILGDEKYLEEIRRTINSVWSDHQGQNIAARYDFLKYKIRQTTKRYCKEKAQKRNLKERELMLEIEHLEQIQELQASLSEENINKLTNNKQELDSLLQYKAKGAWVRSRITYIESHDKSNSFFHSLAKEKHEKQTITELVVDNVETKDQKHILNELKTFYKSLYTTQFLENDTYETNKDNAAFLNVPTVSETEKEISERDISLAELKASLDDFSNNKTPGSDGLSKEFYVALWHEMGPILLETSVRKEIY